MKVLACLLLTLVLPWFPHVAFADPSAFEAERLKAVTANPPGVTLTLRLPEGRTQFHPGEVIPLTAVFASSLAGAYQLNSGPGNRDLPWNSDAFAVDIPSGAVDPLRVHYSREFGEAYSGGGPHFLDLTQQAVPIPYTFNGWLRFEAPGKYRVYLTSGRIIDRGKWNGRFTSFTGRPTTSNAVELDILPDDPVWDAQVLQQALPLYNTDGYNFQKQAAREDAVRTIRFLGTPDAARAMVARYGHFADDFFWSSPAYYQTRIGLFGFPQPGLVLQEMERKIADPDFPVFSYFLEDMAQVRFLVNYPEPLPPIPWEDAPKAAQAQVLYQARRAALKTFQDQDRHSLALAVNSKRGKARAVSGFTLLMMDYDHQDTTEHRDLARALVPVFDDLTPEEQSDLLEDGNWKYVSEPNMLPLLRRVFVSPSPEPETGSVRDYEARQRRSLALRRITELSPAEGRALLLTEIASLHPRVDMETLCSLPDQRLPALDDVLASNLESCLQNRGGDWQIGPRLVERYATPAILPRVKAAYGDNGGKWACDIQSNLVAYFLRTDPGYGLQQMEKALASRKETGCYQSVLSDVAALAPGPVVERLAVTHLEDPDLQVAADAAKTLGACGSSTAEASLWARLREWHEQWAGKVGPIEPNAQNAAPVPGQLEYALTQALATAPGWLADRSKLQDLRNLCVTQDARTWADTFLADWEVPMRVRFERDRNVWSVAQYHEIASVPALESKLEQFPRGIRFLLSASGFHDARQQDVAYESLRPFLERHGLSISKENLPAH